MSGGGFRGNKNAVKYTDEMIQEIANNFEKYINENDVPIVAEFAYKNNIPIQTLYDLPVVSEITKRCIAKKQANLEKGALANKLNTTMAIFSLKQMGWTDRIDTVNKHEIQGDMLKRISELFTKES